MHKNVKDSNDHLRIYFSFASFTPDIRVLKKHSKKEEDEGTHAGFKENARFMNQTQRVAKGTAV